MLIQKWNAAPQPFGADVLADDQRSVLDRVARGFWAWYAAHKDDKVAGFWFITVRVRDLRWLFVEIFGEPGR